MPLGGNDDDETSALPPRRNQSLVSPPNKFSETSTSNGLASTYDFDDDDYDDDQEVTDSLVKQTAEVLQRVEDGWSADELRPVITKLVDHVQHLVRALIAFPRKTCARMRYVTNLCLYLRPD